MRQRKRPRKASPTKCVDECVKEDAVIACRVLAEYAHKFTNAYVLENGVLPTVEDYMAVFSGGIEVLLRKERGMQLDD